MPIIGIEAELVVFRQNWSVGYEEGVVDDGFDGAVDEVDGKINLESFFGIGSDIDEGQLSRDDSSEEWRQKLFCIDGLEKFAEVALLRVPILFQAQLCLGFSCFERNFNYQYKVKESIADDYHQPRQVMSIWLHTDIDETD